jgi:ATP-dependent RNA/DNA helicase IGHMBP2
VVEIIRQAVDLKQKVLVCGPSNISIDNIVEKLSDAKMKKIVRLGHPARIMDSIIKHSLDYNLIHGEGSSVVINIRKDIEKEFKKLSKTRGPEKKSIWNEIRTLKKELKKNEKKAIVDVLKYSNVVLTTCTGAMDYSLKDVVFDLVIVDEACQTLETACWIPLIKGSKCILAGDPFQLPPTILCKDIQKKLEITLFERLYKKHKSEISRMLQIQYRMNEEIMNWSSNEFYEGKLVAHDSVKDRLLTDLEEYIESLVIF